MCATVYCDGALDEISGSRGQLNPVRYGVARDILEKYVTAPSPDEIDVVRPFKKMFMASLICVVFRRQPKVSARDHRWAKH